MFSAIVAVLGALVGLWKKYFSTEALYWRQKLDIEKQKGKQDVEAERLDATYRRIEGEATKGSADELAKGLTEK
ncbi:MAG: hypothetical protein Q7T26_10625, partial [Dehalococcoidia bacterium]|nr:hypothetical protein [Dehalococcoidia bacterium]